MKVQNSSDIKKKPNVDSVFFTPLSSETPAVSQHTDISACHLF